jgi:3-methyladenine DNA glycosylase AlkD
MTPRQLAQRARAALRNSSDPRVAARQRTFFKPWEKVHTLGVTTPELRRIERDLYQIVRKEWGYAEAVDFCELLMKERHIECKSLGLMLLARHSRQFDEDLLRAVKRWLEGGLCDNWAISDQLSTQVIASLIGKFELLASAVESWHDSPNLWVRRSSVVPFVKHAGKGRDLDRAYRIVTALLPDSHDLIHKATGWVLRECGKADAARLEKYLLEHGPSIPRTTLRYAIDRFPEAKRQRVLQKTKR